MNCGFAVGFPWLHIWKSLKINAGGIRYMKPDDVIEHAVMISWAYCLHCCSVITFLNLGFGNYYEIAHREKQFKKSLRLKI
jgi:hypothetical protein